MVVVKATKRDETGSRKVRRLRKEGMVPGIIYGHGETPVAIKIEQGDLEKAVGRGERLLEVSVDGGSQNVLIKEVQYDVYGHHVTHIDLARVNLDERVKLTVPIMLRGRPAGAAEEGVLQQVAMNAEIECEVRSIPEDIKLSVVSMNVGDVMRMKDLPLPEGAKLLSDPEFIVCTVTILAEEVVEAPAEGGAAEPEVIGEKKEEEAAEGAEAEAGKEKEKEKDKGKEKPAKGE